VPRSIILRATAGTTKDVPGLTGREPTLDQVVAQNGRDRHAATAVAALWLDLARVHRPAATNAHQPSGEIDILEAKRLQSPRRSPA
jgi:hypothetical protein